MIDRIRVVLTDRRMPGWPGRVTLVHDTHTGRFYAVNTLDYPWQDGPRSLVYRTDEHGHAHSVPGWGSGLLIFVAGGQMSGPEAIRDLTERLETGKLLTPSEAVRIEEDLIERELDGLSRFITPRHQGGGEGR